MAMNSSNDSRSSGGGRGEVIDYGSEIPAHSGAGRGNRQYRDSGLLQQEEMEEESGNREIPDPESDENGAYRESQEDQEEADEEVSAHNRSHDSLESRRTIIEADDFASFLALEDEDDEDYMNDFRDEDIDFDSVGDQEGGGVDLSLLLGGGGQGHGKGNNPYMLDFTSGMLGDSEVEEDEDDEDDGTLSYSGGSQEKRTPGHVNGGGADTAQDRGSSEHRTENGGGDSGAAWTPRSEGGGARRRSKKSRSVKKTESWLRHSSSFQHRSLDAEEGEECGPVAGRSDQEDEDEELESPPRNFREEINNNVAKMNFSTGTNLFVSGDGRGDFHSTSTPIRGSGLPGLSKYFIHDDSTMPALPPSAASSSAKPQQNHDFHHHHQFQQTSGSVPALPPHKPKPHHGHHHHQHHHPPHQHQQQQHHPDWHPYHDGELQQPDFEPPNSQSSPRLRRSFDGSGRATSRHNNYHHPHSNHNYHADDYDLPSQRDHQSPTQQFRPASPSRLHSYPLETPLGTRPRSLSASLDNLYRPDPSPSTCPSVAAGHVRGAEPPEANQITRRNSLPNIPAALHHSAAPGFPVEASLQRGVNATAGLCQNCGFSRNDYLFKIGYDLFKSILFLSTSLKGLYFKSSKSQLYVFLP